MRPWTPRRRDLQRYKVTHAGTEKKRPRLAENTQPDPMQPRQLLRYRADCLVPHGQDKIEFGLDLVGGADADRARRDQRLCD
jgi:hypothetical protein